MWKRLASVILGAVLAGAWCPAAAQLRPPGLSDYLQPSGFPSTVRSVLQALGSRLQSPGAERVTVLGTLNVGGASRGAVLTWELPAKFRVDEQGATPKALVLPGLAVPASMGTLDKLDRSLLETLFVDTPDYFLYACKAGAAVRFLGSRFRTGDGANPDYKGPYYNVFEFVFGDPFSPGKPIWKKYVFDWQTGLLNRVITGTDQEGKPAQVVTTLDGWRTDAGFPFPGLVQRTEDGELVISFQVTQVQFGPARADGVFGTGHDQGR